MADTGKACRYCLRRLDLARTPPYLFRIILIYPGQTRIGKRVTGLEQMKFDDMADNGRNCKPRIVPAPGGRT